MYRHIYILYIRYYYNNRLSFKWSKRDRCSTATAAAAVALCKTSVGGSVLLLSLFFFFTIVAAGSDQTVWQYARLLQRINICSSFAIVVYISYYYVHTCVRLCENFYFFFIIILFSYLFYCCY